ncbi:MAG: phosphodiester glycosidase family protein [Phycisphaerae bacterium]|nr:phosphodiester glycosidase family protein [Phycisphaerae bacterium]
MDQLTAILLFPGAAALIVGLASLSRGRFWRNAVASLLIVLGTASASAAGYRYWYFHRPIPEPITQQLFDGVTYERLILQSPRPLVVHVVAIDLVAQGIGFLVTPPDPDSSRQLKARTTAEFVRDHKVQVAVNAMFFMPWHSNGPFDYYPHSGDPVDVKGLAISRGRTYSSVLRPPAVLSISRDNRATIGAPVPNAYNAVSGDRMLIRDGTVLRRDLARLNGIAPRTAVALDRSGRRLLLIVVDGRQPNYSEGVSFCELADLVRSVGGHNAMSLDGGGSSSLVVEGAGGRPRVVNSPCHGLHPPGRLRPVANHLGVFARRLPQKPNSRPPVP